MNSLIETLFGLPAGCLSRGEGWSFAFAAEYSGYVKLALLATAAFMIYVAARSYRREGDAPRRVKALLTGLRIAVILLAVGILLRPSVVVRTAQTLYRTVILLVDKSFSMSARDDYAGSKAGPPLSKALGVPQADLEKLRRFDIARRVLAEPVDRIARDHRVVVLAFGRQGDPDEKYTRRIGELSTAGARSASRPAAQLDEMLRALKPDGLETDLAAALWDALEEGRGHRVASIVLVSDGQNTSDGQERLRAALAQANQLRVSVHAIAVGDPNPRPAITEVLLEAPPDMRPDGESDFVIRLTSRHCGGQEAVVSLLRRERPAEPWTPACPEQKVVLEGPKATPGEPLAPEAPRASQSLTVRPKAEARRAADYAVEYKASVKAPAGAKESLSVSVTVSDSRINVLMISGDAGWEFQRLKDLLYRSPERYGSSIWQQNADAEINQAASSGMKIERIPRTLEELMGSPDGKPFPGYQVVILYDPQPTAGGFDEAFIENLHTFVARHKGGLCYIAGNKYSEALLVGDRRSKALAGMLPVELNRNPINYAARIKDKKPAPSPLRLTVHGVDNPILRLADDPEESRRAWATPGLLPGVFWMHPVLRVKPAARVLAVNPSRQMGRDAAEPVIVSMPLGGKVLYVGTDETWRWLVASEGKYYRRFWHNAIRSLAPQTKAKRVVLYTEGEQFYQTEKIPVLADVYDKDFQPVVTKDGTFTAELIDALTGKSRPVLLRAIDAKDRPGQYKGTLEPDAPGTYRLTAMRGDPLADKIVESRRIVIKPPDAETQRPEANAQALARIAEANCLPAQDAAALPDQIPPGKIVTVTPKTYPLWDTFAMLAAIVVLLTVEWILRKKHNMI